MTGLGGGDDDGVGGPADVGAVRELPTRAGDARGTGISSDRKLPRESTATFVIDEPRSVTRPGVTGQTPGAGPPMKIILPRTVPMLLGSTFEEWDVHALTAIRTAPTTTPLFMTLRRASFAGGSRGWGLDEGLGDLGERVARVGDTTVQGQRP